MLPTVWSENLFDDLFDLDKAFFGTRNPLYGKHGKDIMKTDVQESDTSYTVDIDLPGFKKDEVNVELKDGYLTVSAAKGLDKDEKDQQGRYIRQERYTGACSRSFYVGDVQPEDVKAKFEDGVLKLAVPKKDVPALEAKNQITIE